MQYKLDYQFSAIFHLQVNSSVDFRHHLPTATQTRLMAHIRQLNSTKIWQLWYNVKIILLVEQHGSRGEKMIF
jgi:cell division inhibitor SulA